MEIFVSVNQIIMILAMIRDTQHVLTVSQMTIANNAHQQMLHAVTMCVYVMLTTDIPVELVETKFVLLLRLDNVPKAVTARTRTLFVIAAVLVYVVAPPSTLERELDCMHIVNVRSVTCPSDEFSVIFVIDTSGSVDDTENAIQKDFVKDLLSRSNYRAQSGNGVYQDELTLINFAYFAQIESPNNNDCYTYAQRSVFDNVIDNAPKIGSQTNHADVLRKMIKLLDDCSNKKKDFTFAIFMTDGYQNIFPDIEPNRVADFIPGIVARDVYVNVMAIVEDDDPWNPAEIATVSTATNGDFIQTKSFAELQASSSDFIDSFLGQFCTSFVALIAETGCSDSCHRSGVDSDPPTTSQTFLCVGGRFGSDCIHTVGSTTLNIPRGEQRTVRTTCNFQVACPGAWGAWGAWGQCSETCRSRQEPPSQTRSRTCDGGTYGGDCGNSDSTERQNCNANTRCIGTIQLYNTTGCSAACQLNNVAPTFVELYVCFANFFLNVCFRNGDNAEFTHLQTYEIRKECNTQACPATLGPYSPYGPCSAPCNVADNINIPPKRRRTRSCTGGSPHALCHFTNVFNQNITLRSGETYEEFQTCNNFGCKGTLTPFEKVGDCPSTCHLYMHRPPLQLAVRACVNATLDENCDGADLEEHVPCNVNISCPGFLSPWGAWTDCSRTCHEHEQPAPTRARKRTCLDYSFDAFCKNEPLKEIEECNVDTICPMMGSWGAFGPFGECSVTCGYGQHERRRNCTQGMPPSAGDDCGPVKFEIQTAECFRGECPQYCPKKKPCYCLTVPDRQTPPMLSAEFETRIHTAVATLKYWTKDIQKQICDDCHIMRLEMSVATVDSQINSVKTLYDELAMMKEDQRRTISCNQNGQIEMGLWHYYDMWRERMSMLKGVITELEACKMRFDAALNACKSYNWFHFLVRKMNRKDPDVEKPLTA